MNPCPRKRNARQTRLAGWKDFWHRPGQREASPLMAAIQKIKMKTFIQLLLTLALGAGVQPAAAQ
jgi:hypothetical protein